MRGRARQTRRPEELARELALVIAAVRAEGAVPLRQIAAALNARGIPAARGGAWTATQVRRVS
ncbi:recombinase-like helix-turn-helix domain-containing protein [Methylobacterium sp. J-070]|uniref:recombinase-like helix-turn-helix domain-containing protein n=1 Tax=Methylobacterium sp. J-070 TaxID=2836650 RepID=UPI0028C4E13C|nr:recombinase-like helix-turn-helix domain-containing protein [Methylobacterium sp. J-070]